MKRDDEIKRQEILEEAELEKAMDFLQENDDKWFTFDKIKEGANISEIGDWDLIRYDDFFEKIERKHIDDEKYFTVKANTENFLLIGIISFMAIITVILVVV